MKRTTAPARPVGAHVYPRLALIACLGASMGCVGAWEEPGATPYRPGQGRPHTPGDTSLDDPAMFGPAGIRRLTRTELRSAIADLYGVDVQSDLDALPIDQFNEEETGNPFDNDYTFQQTGPALVEGLDLLAGRVADQITENPAARESLVGCRPSGPADEACFASFVERVGRRALRRPLDSADVDEIRSALLPHAVEAGDFYVAVNLAIRVLIQHVEFVYRVEVGEEIAPGSPIHRLTDFEIASRLAFLVWGSVPDDALLDAAAAGRLADVNGVQDEALRMLEDPRAAQQIETFHAKWLGYDAAPAAAGSLEEDFRVETDALVRAVTIENQGEWTELFTWDETYVTPRLADHYGLPAVGEPGWVPSGPNRGGGILSQASYLGVDSRFGDTSPTFRGRNIWRRVLCRDIGAPPAGVNVDEVPGSAGDCKTERYFMSREAGCEGCHRNMDPIGFGLEQLDAMGRFRDVEASNAMCGIDGRGEFPGVGGFEGPRELGQILADESSLDDCVTRQFYRFAVGRSEGIEDEAALDALSSRLSQDGDFIGLVLSFVGSEAFLHRVVDETN
ncbi:MAG: DUF1592 domain-containing protein [Sandaracinaceae bacterium]